MVAPDMTNKEQENDFLLLDSKTDDGKITKDMLLAFFDNKLKGSD